MSSALCFNLDQSKILLYGIELTLYHTIPTFNDLEKEAFLKQSMAVKCWHSMKWSWFFIFFLTLSQTIPGFYKSVIEDF